MKKQRWLVLLTLVLAVSFVLAACGSNNNNSAANSGNGGSNTGSSNAGGEEKLAADQTLRINFAADVPTFDPAQAQDNQAHTALNLMYEGLVRVDENSKEVPGVAESWEPDSTGKVYTFHLRKDAKWSNGDPVTANDFVFAWQRVLDPKTQPAPAYAYQLFYLKNAEAYNQGKITDFSQVGVKAVDDYTLEVTLENTTPYFVNLTSFYTYFPVHKSVADNDKWATDPSTMITNGPFTLTGLVTGQSMEFTKNPNYWDNKDIKLDKIKATVVNSAATEVLSYQSGELDRAGQPNGNIPADQIQILKDQYKDEFHIDPVASLYYYEFNTKAKPFDNAKIRKAFAMAIDRQAIVDNVTKAGQVPAFGLIPPGINGAEKSFREEYPEDYFKEDVTEAKKLLQEGMAEEGITSLPPITLTYNTDDNHKKIALAITDMWKKNLGVDVKIENQEWGVFIKNRQSGDFQVARAGWVPDYNDPMTFIDMWTTKSGNNDIKLNDPTYDSLVEDAYKNPDNKARMEDFRKAEQILIGDQMGIMPIYYYTNPALVKPYLKGVTLDYSGSVDYSRAYLLEH
ncbi:peptide-binding protein [Paenibacillus yonginensis]|uniref:Peptide-binding protein n=1 Tax=Paenibacillus yonginensis TaxID=1462996 RepID=A0A1B1N137_9BACL|nr:peptide ABC transporter substrate-binding protein [Paenibacillus yonginensis]ANS75126.1 peptide-binding protein [Paenibacillus yonginensis]